MDKLYSFGDPIDSCYVLENSSFSFQCKDTPSYTLSAPRSYLGTFELLLAESGASRDTRISEVSIDTTSKCAPISNNFTLKLLEDSDEGMAINKTLAQLLEQTNKTLRDLHRGLPHEWNSCQRKTKLFFELTNSLSLLSNELGIGHLISLARDYTQTDTYHVGKLVEPVRMVSSISATRAIETGTIRFESEQVFCHCGHDADSMYFLLEGKIFVSSSEHTIASIDTPGECFGELAFFLDGTRTADLVATARSAILRVTKESLPAFLADHPDMLLHIGKTLAKRLEQNTQKIALYSKLSSPETPGSVDKCHDDAQSALANLLNDLRKVIRISFNDRLMNFIREATVKIKATAEPPTL